MPSHHPERSQELQGLLRRLRPEILHLLEIYAVPEEQAAEIVHDTFMALAVRWSRVGNHRIWILGTIETRCRAVAAERSASGPSARREPDGEDGEGDT